MAEKSAHARKKLTVTSIEMAKQPAGFTFKGKFLGRTQSQPFQELNEKTGEIVTKTLTFAIFEDDKGDRFKVIQDAGLKSSLDDAMVKEGQAIEVVKLEKKSLKGARSMNQYDIFAL